jgi:hypothetical protein
LGTRGLIPTKEKKEKSSLSITLFETKKIIWSMLNTYKGVS